MEQPGETPPGGHAAERLREHLRDRFGGDDLAVLPEPLRPDEEPPAADPPEGAPAEPEPPAPKNSPAAP